MGYRAKIKRIRVVMYGSLVWDPALHGGAGMYVSLIF
ncbi:MAG: hypothetical protein Hyperionvirus2_24 [Hyperionvirus sp.]|uniref:Uncharacterized protein n=1 Tax=Hyperionvirus sp. TaxID=2487770 RepID=A0A3G5A5Y4_9VIRU|nr:MAG: hypothetical protein Hyperionvirus2_24 [Hyperionvirus sp.]